MTGKLQVLQSMNCSALYTTLIMCNKPSRAGPVRI